MSAGIILTIVLGFMALLLVIGCPIGFSILISTSLESLYRIFLPLWLP